MSRSKGTGIFNARPWPKITSTDKKTLRKWVRDWWEPGQEVDSRWHPVAQWHWRKLDRAHARKQA